VNARPRIVTVAPGTDRIVKVPPASTPTQGWGRLGALLQALIVTSSVAFGSGV